MRLMITIFSILMLTVIKSSCQHASALPQDPSFRGDHALRVMFYNVENLFDTSDDPATDDDDFLPSGAYSWTYYKYRKKLNNIGKTIIAVGGWEAPEIIGLAEIENWQVLFDLCRLTPLNTMDYGIVHENSPDRRGVDVGILYRKGKLRLCDSQTLPVVFQDDSIAGRDILHARFMGVAGDTLNVFVNHWPSRFAGTEITASRRGDAARVLNSCVKELIRLNPMSNIIILGDFNDNPDDHSIRVILDARIYDGSSVGSSSLINLMNMNGMQGKGTLYHKEAVGRWYIYDQIIVSQGLIHNEGWSAKYPHAFIFRADWLLDPVNGVPLRSFKGPVFTGGFSDHLPVYFDLEWRDITN